MRRNLRNIRLILLALAVMIAAGSAQTALPLGGMQTQSGYEQITNQASYSQQSFGPMEAQYYGSGLKHETVSGRILYWLFTEKNGFPEYPTNPTLENDLEAHDIGTRAELEAYGNSIPDAKALGSWNNGATASVARDASGNMVVKIASLGTPIIVPGTIESLAGQPVPIVFLTVYTISSDGRGDWKGDARYRIEAGTDVPTFVSKVLPKQAAGSQQKSY